MKQQQHFLQKGNLLMRSGLLLLFALLLTSGLFAQRQISGNITDEENGEALIGASVLVEGSSTGTITDIDGNFTIQANTDDVLVISYTGYATQSITVGVENVYNVTMSSGVLLDELVVTGYTSQSRRSITGAVSTVDIDEVKAIPAPTIDQALQGKVAGVTIGQSGAPGEGVMVRIRGFGTINNNNPLYIIDGLPIQSAGLNELNPNDIESVQVLKDASAASIYGARAANGVIIITTKKGSVTGEPKVSLNVYYGANYVPTSALEEFATPQELADILFESQRNAHDPSTGEFVFNQPQYGGSSTEAILPDFITPTGAFEGDPNTTADTYSFDRDGGAFNPITRANKAGTDWLDEILDPGTIQSYQLSVTGGNEAASYALSGGYYDQEGVVIHTGFKRYSLRANSQFRVKDRIRVGENLSVVYTNRTNIDGSTNGTGNAVSMAYRMPGIIPVFDIAGNYAGANGTGLTNADNPVALLARGKDDQDRRVRVFGNVYGEVDLIDGLMFKTSVGADYNTTHNSNFTIRNVEASEPDAANNLVEYTDFNVNWNWYNTLTYTTTFADDHDLTLLAGTEAIENEFRTFEATRANFFSDDFSYRYLNTGAAGIGNAGRGSQWSLFSVFGKVDYAYQGKYLLSATIRRDGSSRFGESNRYGVFPAFSAGWRVSEENFLRDVSFINDMKVRVGWGQTGNQEIGDYAFATTYSADLNGAGYPIGGGSTVVGLDSRVFGNPDVKWETTTSLNIGIDASLLNDRISFVFDWYNNDTEGMLLNPRVAATEGFATYAFQNLGDMN
ncbi:MAG: SusC/RagA family TonB-linked outer membrane protein, partial [Bacteroidota bacterium]